MVQVNHITHADDGRIAGFRDLNQAERRRYHAGPDGIVIGEGALVIDRMLDSRIPPTMFLGTQEGLERLQAMPDLESIPEDTPFYLTDEDTISTCVGFSFNRHIFALAPRPQPHTIRDVIKKAPDTIVVLEGLNDHANIGSIFRNAAALGVGGVLLGAGCADPLYRRSVRVSMGHVTRVPFATCPGGSYDWQEPAFTALRKADYRVLALTPAADAQVLSGVAAGGKVAFVVGAEGPGLKPTTLALADERVCIPMYDQVDSLNVATSAAIAFYERTR